MHEGNGLGTADHHGDPRHRLQAWEQVVVALGTLVVILVVIWRFLGMLIFMNIHTLVP
jgi:hypothetical protein